MAFIIALSLALMNAAASSLEIAMRHVVDGEVLQPDSMRYSNSAGEIFSVTRLSYLMSDFGLKRADGSWLELTNHVAWIDAAKSRTTSQVTVPSGEYRAVRFQIGLDAALNHSDPARFAAGHPLNPNLNGLHWNWQGGYVFLALEGMWRTHDSISGYSFHLARDTNAVRVELAGTINVERDARMEINFDLATVLRTPQPVSFAKDGSSTHSRDGDPLTATLVKNLSQAFSLRGLVNSESAPAQATAKAPKYMPEKFTSYRFSMSSTFPVPDLPRDNPLITERVALGEKLFHEPLMSRDGTVSCASCHDSKAAFSDPRKFSVGVSNRVGTRQAMPLFNLAWKSAYFWDGRAATLRAQSLMPIQDHAEMDESLTNVVMKLSGTDRGEEAGEKAESGKRKAENARSGFVSVAPNEDYQTLFIRAFGSPEITAEKIGLALEQFLLTLTSFDSKFDRAIAGTEQLTDEEQRGLTLFMTEYDPRRGQYGADCFHCHGGPLFQSQTFANNGLDATATDAGRAKVSGKESDRGKFATPSLRNIALTAPYMHDGRFKTLEEVIEHYSTGVKRSATLDPNLANHPDGGLNLGNDDKRALVAFLKTLTGNRLTASEPRRMSLR